MPHEDLLKELKERDAEALAMGGAEKLAKRKAEGVLNARERLARLLDEDSFIESGRYARSIRPEVKHKTPADGKIAGFGRIDGREVAIVSNDFTVLGAARPVLRFLDVVFRDVGFRGDAQRRDHGRRESQRHLARDRQAHGSGGTGDRKSVV